MKQKDIAVIVIVIFFSGIISFFVSNAVFVTPQNRQQQVEVVEAINSNFPTTNTKYFNNQAIDPTQLIQIGTTTNPNPFNGTTH